jgi:hypothetical protein
VIADVGAPFGKRALLMALLKLDLERLATDQLLERRDLRLELLKRVRRPGVVVMFPASYLRTRILTRLRHRSCRLPRTEGAAPARYSPANWRLKAML